MASREFHAAKDLLPTLLCRLAREGGPIRPLQALWAEVAGAQLARQARVVDFKEDVLRLSVRSAAWAQALTRQEAVLCSRLNSRIGPPGIRSLQFQVE